MKICKGFSIRLLAILMSIAMLFLATLIAVAAEPGMAEPDYAVILLEEEKDGEQETEAAIGFLAWLWDAFWANFQLFSFMFNLDEMYSYNSRLAFQWIFGFTPLFDPFAPVIGAFIDTLRCTFDYGGREWRVQMWKGSYLFGLNTGGEIGLYSRSSARPLDHFGAAFKQDWIGMEMAVYHHDHRLFLRPMETRWWQTGYSLFISEDVLSSRHVTMVSALRFNTEGKAQAFADTLYEWGFVRCEEIPRWYTPDRFLVDGETVHLSWRSIFDD